MDRVGCFVLGLVLIAGCAIPGGAPTLAPTADPNAVAPFLTPAPPTLAPGETPTSRPSGSCIFTLDIANETNYLVRVQINGLNVRTVNPRGTLRLMDHEDGLPQMPWDVVLVKAADGRMLSGASFNADEIDGYLVAREGEASRSSSLCAPG